MLKNVIINRVVRAKRCGQDKRDLVLPNHVAAAFPHAVFRSAVGHRLKTQRALVKMRRLFGVTDVKLDVICTLEGQKIFSYRRSGFLFWSSNCRWHNDLLTLSRSARL